MQVPLSKNAVTVLERRYLIKDETGQVIETPDEMFHRVARNLAEAEAKWGGDVALWEERFYTMMRSLKFLPNSPTLMNAGRPVAATRAPASSCRWATTWARSSPRSATRR